MTTLAKGLTVLRRLRRGAADDDAVARRRGGAACRAPPRGGSCARSTELGYVAQNGRQFSLSPRILELGFAYLSTQSWIDQALPLMQAARRAMQEIVLRGDSAGHRDRLRRAHPDAPHHVARR